MYLLYIKDISYIFLIYLFIIYISFIYIYIFLYLFFYLISFKSSIFFLKLRGIVNQFLTKKLFPTNYVVIKKLTLFNSDF